MDDKQNLKKKLNNLEEIVSIIKNLIISIIKTLKLYKDSIGWLKMAKSTIIFFKTKVKRFVLTKEIYVLTQFKVIKNGNKTTTFP